MGVDEEGTHERLKALRRELLDPKIAALIRTLTDILGKIRPEPAREPLPQRKHYETPRATAARRRRAGR